MTDETDGDNDDDNDNDQIYDIHLHTICWALNPIQPFTLGALSVWQFVWYNGAGASFPCVFCAIEFSS